MRPSEDPTGYPHADLPDWLLKSESYEPVRDRDGFIAQSMLRITAVLSQFRLDDGKSRPWSPSAPAKLVVGLGCILLTSLSSNFAFTMTMLALVLVRMCLLPAACLRRTVTVAIGAALLSFLVMVPAILIGQPHSAILVSTKVLVSVGTAMIVALTTPFNELTSALRVFHVPNVFIMTLDLALKNIVRLGDIALEVLTALRLRSVGRNRVKQTAMGGVGGMLFLKTQEAATATFEAMNCRGFEGEYVVTRGRRWRNADVVWLAMLGVLAALAIYLQKLV